ncbi:Putative RNA polymerase I-specific transcription initiation factor Rrn10 [Septoria linicola]|uniref:RNA polymerase I-specific transcription initiation factor Rrn10 n=1 Tax=Septoria linicola TaxID=215465 RepID=A0A9Q9AL40_9PEZI|nr:putative RNA polymerase I-specific transcription initiation factor Rrn10 [Septoria linicola]USW47946.1 Putative RNA polymerase I-specific transcription initiation factor Rrn10 [Septoria linicola]
MPDHDSGKSRVTLYDAVAGRVGYEGWLLDKGGKPLPPDQVLYRRANAPVRYAEDDPYFAHRHLAPGNRLPDSDLLKTIHAYASDFYGSVLQHDAHDDFRSLDETALLALGILLEEAAAHSLKDTGDLAFVEGAEKEQAH